jgi:hypothetical protein
MKQLDECKDPYETELLQSLIKLYDLNLIEVVFESGETLFKASDDVITGVMADEEFDSLHGQHPDA